MWNFLTGVLSNDGEPSPTRSPEEIRKVKQMAFLEACSLSRFDFARKLLTEQSGGVMIGIDDVIDGESGNTALLRACDRWEIEQVTFLIEAGANVDARNFHGETALIRACNCVSDYKIVNLLVKKAGANVRVVTKTGDDNALARIVSTTKWTQNQQIDYSNALQTFFYLKTVKVLVKSGATLMLDPLLTGDPFKPDLILPQIARFYAFSRGQESPGKRFRLSPRELETVVRPLLIKLLIAARQRSSFEMNRLRQLLKGAPKLLFHDDSNNNVDINDFLLYVQSQFPLKLKELCRFAILRQLPIGYQRRRQAIDQISFNNNFKNAEDLRNYLKFKDLKHLMQTLELKAIHGIGI